MDLSFDLLKSKEIDKSKLVQVQVTVNGKNGTYTRMQWKKPSDITSSDRVIANQNKGTDTPSVSQLDSKKRLAEILSQHSRNSIMEFAKKNGVQWKENSHEAINWMRASMAIQESIKTNPKIWKTFGVSPQPKSAQNTLKKDTPQKSTVDKQKIQEITKNYDKKQLLDLIKSKGVTWNEHSHPAINWMRAIQSLGKAISENPALADELQATKTDTASSKQPKPTQNGVQELQDLVSTVKKQSSSKKGNQTKDKSDVLKGISTNTMSSYEKKKFGDIVSSASPENLRNYRTLGMCAGDKESEQYLANLYEKYSKAIQGNTVHDPNIDADPLRNKLQGVVNKMLVGTTKSSLKNIRKRITQFTAQQKLLEPWTDPNSPLTEEQKNYIKHGLRPYFPGDRRRECQSEHECDHKMMHKVLDKFKKSQEYGELAEEYDKLLTEFDQLTQSNFIFQCAVNGAGNGSGVQSAEEYEKGLNSSIKSKIEDYEKSLKITTDEDNKKYCKKKLSELKDLKSKINGDNLVKAAKIREKLFDSKFTDLNANLYHYKMMASQLSFLYEIKKDFVNDYPVLSKDNLDKLDKGDEDSLVNLSLHAGMFKPSLSKNGNSAKDTLMDKYSERQEFLDAYGGVTQVSGNSSYAENNEIRCKISKASSSKSKQIINNIAKDWDKSTHGQMKYKIKGVYEVSGLQAEKEFNNIKGKNSKYKNKKSGGKNCSSDLFYHGTGSMATSLILGHSGQFKVVKAKVGRMLGDGIYLADKSSKSAQYISDTGFSRHGISGSLMVVEASLGDTLHSRTSSGYKYDSIHAGKSDGLLNNEWCVHNPNAVIPRYLVEMEII